MVYPHAEYGALGRQGLGLGNCLHPPSPLGGGGNHVSHPLWGMCIRVGSHFRTAPGYVFMLMLPHCVPSV